MKHISGILLIVLVMLLQFVPCSDSIALNRNIPGQSQFTEASGAHADPATDVCSPFCSCACCSIPVVVRPAPQSDTDIAVPFHNYTVYLMPILNKVPQAFWQPPRY